MMFRRSAFVGLAALAVGICCLSTLTGCDSVPTGSDPIGDLVDDGNGDGGDPDEGGGDGSPTVTFGADQPAPEVVEARPRAINPYAANAGAQLPTFADLTKDLPPVGNQGALGSCTAWAAGYAGATYTANRQFGWGTDTRIHQASPGYLYEKLLASDGLPCGSGTSVMTSISLLIQGGCSSLDIVEYADDVCAPDPAETDAFNFRIGSYNRVVQTDRHALRGELAVGRIVVFGAHLYDDFLSFTGTEVYRGSGVLLREDERDAAHAMAVVGYDDERGAYRIMNSWGTQWGDGGFAWMDYETFELTVFEAYSFEPIGVREPPPPPDPVVDSDPEAFLDEAYQFADADPVTRDPLVYLVFFYHFDAPIYIHTLTVTDPFGATAEQVYDTWYLDGYVYFVREDGFQWEPGTYGLEFDTETLAGNSVIYTGQALIDPLVVVDEPDNEGACSNICLFAYDGECDDGGINSDYAVCPFGTDCFDCGVRADEDALGGDEWCNDTCRFAADGECDDGGEGSAYSVCAYGGDCFDCGSREPAEVVVLELCSDACRFAFDGVCDDGGAGAEFDVCDFGTDCFDCGPREVDAVVELTELCDDSCNFAFDGECDDGGAGAEFAECALGSDCSDCGPREVNNSAAVRRATLPSSDPRTFRKIPVVTPHRAETLPAAGVRPGVLGANRQPAIITDPSR